MSRDWDARARELDAARELAREQDRGAVVSTIADTLVRINVAPSMDASLEIAEQIVQALEQMP